MTELEKRTKRFNFILESLLAMQIAFPLLVYLAETGVVFGGHIAALIISLYVLILFLIASFLVFWAMWLQSLVRTRRPDFSLPAAFILPGCLFPPALWWIQTRLLWKDGRREKILLAAGWILLLSACAYGVSLLWNPNPIDSLIAMLSVELRIDESAVSPASAGLDTHLLSFSLSGAFGFILLFLYFAPLAAKHPMGKKYHRTLIFCILFLAAAPVLSNWCIRCIDAKNEDILAFIARHGAAVNATDMEKIYLNGQTADADWTAYVEEMRPKSPYWVQKGEIGGDSELFDQWLKEGASPDSFAVKDEAMIALFKKNAAEQAERYARMDRELAKTPRRMVYDFERLSRTGYLEMLHSPFFSAAKYMLALYNRRIAVALSSADRAEAMRLFRLEMNLYRTMSGELYWMLPMTKIYVRTMEIMLGSRIMNRDDLAELDRSTREMDGLLRENARLQVKSMYMEYAANDLIIQTGGMTEIPERGPECRYKNFAGAPIYCAFQYGRSLVLRYRLGMCEGLLMPPKTNPDFHPPYIYRKIESSSPSLSDPNDLFYGYSFSWLFFQNRAN